VSGIRPIRRAAVWVAVVALHCLLATLLYESFSVRRPPPIGAALQILEVKLINVPLPVPEADSEPAESPPPTRSAEAESPSAFIASGGVERTPGSWPAAPVIDALGFDGRGLSEACAHAYPETASDLRTPGTLTLLVRVEPSGRPSELKVVVSSGSTTLDQAAGACLMALGSLAPTLVEGRRVSGWQRVVWPRRAPRLRD
jgi:TonB family protein